jgi:ectoine hydroxylase-related dioxygenase (phytanoyl-CoA dioxygenase family)
MSVWIPLVETNEENSTLAFFKGGHLKGETARHTFDNENAWYTRLSLEDMKKTLFDDCTQEEFDEKKTVINCKPGDILLFPGTTPHRSLKNKTE